jgi:hypothetical protein
MAKSVEGALHVTVHPDRYMPHRRLRTEGPTSGPTRRWRTLARRAAAVACPALSRPAKKRDASGFPATAPQMMLCRWTRRLLRANRPRGSILSIGDCTIYAQFGSTANTKMRTAASERLFSFEESPPSRHAGSTDLSEAYAPIWHKSGQISGLVKGSGFVPWFRKGQISVSTVSPRRHQSAPVIARAAPDPSSRR